MSQHGLLYSAMLGENLLHYKQIEYQMLVGSPEYILSLLFFFFTAYFKQLILTPCHPLIIQACK